MKFVLSSFFFRNFIYTIYLAKTKPKDKKKSCLLYNKIIIIIIIIIMIIIILKKYILKKNLGRFI